MVLGVLAILAASAAVIAFPLGLPVVMGVLGTVMGIGSALLFSSIHALARNIKESKQKKRLEQLYNKPSSHSQRISSRDEEDFGSLKAYNSMIDKFQDLNVSLSRHSREVFQNAGEDGQELVRKIERMSENYRSAIDLLKQRPEIHRDEIIVESKDSVPHYKTKNDLLVRIGTEIAEKLPNLGGALSLRFKALSKRMEKIHTGVTIGLVVGGIACIAVIAALLPGSILALPLLVAATLGISLAVIGLSYGLREILKRTKANKRQLYHDLTEVVDIQLLNDMTKYQEGMLRLLAKTLDSEKSIAELSQPIYKKYLTLESHLTYLQEQLKEMEFKLKFLSNGYAKRALMLEKGLQQASDNPRVARRQETDDSEFDDLVAMGTRAAQERRRKDSEGVSVLSDYSELSLEEREFGDAWSPKGSRKLENFWNADISFGREDEMLLTEGVAEEILQLKKEIKTVQQEIEETEQKFLKSESLKLQAGQGSDALVGIWYNVRSSTVNCLNVLRNLQVTLFKLIQSGENE